MRYEEASNIGVSSISSIQSILPIPPVTVPVVVTLNAAFSYPVKP